MKKSIDGEYDLFFDEFYFENGMIHQIMAYYSPQHGNVECKNQMLIEKIDDFMFIISILSQNLLGRLFY